jgi:hypothetical protein
MRAWIWAGSGRRGASELGLQALVKVTWAEGGAHLPGAGCWLYGWLVDAARWGRLRLGFAYFGGIGLATLLLVATYAGLVVLGSVNLAFRVLTTLAIIVVLTVVVWCCFLLVLDVDDWWNDFKDQNRFAVRSGAFALATLAIGVGLGCWLVG